MEGKLVDHGGTHKPRVGCGSSSQPDFQVHPDMTKTVFKIHMFRKTAWLRKEGNEKNLKR